MAQSQFSVCSGLVVNSTPVTGNGVFTIYTSSTLANPNNIGSLRLVADYASPVPLDGGPTPITYGLGLVCETMQNGVWFPIAYQFEPFKNPQNGRQRIIVMQPDFSSADAGIDDIIYVGDETIARVSRQQGRIPGAGFRVRMLCDENGHGGPGAFQQVTMTINGEMYDA